MDDQILHHFMEDLAPIIIGVVVTFATAWVITVSVLSGVKLQEKTNRFIRRFLYV